MTRARDMANIAAGSFSIPLGALGNVPDATAAGTVVPWGGSTAPTGWLECDGSAVSRTTYADLFTAIGTTYGVGDGSTTFNLPDLRGEFIRGWDNGKGTDSGRTLGSFQTDELKSHSHYISGFGNGSDLNGGPFADGGARPASYSSTSTGGTETRPRNIAMMYCIKT